MSISAENGNIDIIKVLTHQLARTAPEMKNSSKKLVSLLKESQSNDSNYRKEHIFYDNDGNVVDKFEGHLIINKNEFLSKNRNNFI